MSVLPIEDVLPDLKRVLSNHDAAVLQAPPGAGKTTRVPLALLPEAWLEGQSILMLEPRRLAATNAARYMAAQLSEDAGGTVGYAIRYDRRVSKQTRIEVVTEGILTRRLQADPLLDGVGLIIFDEFHERNLNSDLALALCRDAQLGLRPDLKLLVMSATLDGEPVSRLLGDAPLVSSKGRSYPVDIRYLPKDPSGPVAEVTAQAVCRALRETDGDLLVFLPGAGEIQRCHALLQNEAPSALQICPLYGSLSFAAQERAILPSDRRKVVLATNIAETSLTIEGVQVVVDSGLERRPRFDPVAGTTRLERTKISQASSDQRAGRAGRLGPGVCYRLWCKGTQGSLLPFTPPEIRGADLMPLALDLARWGVTDAAALPWMDEPPQGALLGARQLLIQLGALDSRSRITPLGERMADYPAHPRLARLLHAGREAGRSSLACDLVALLSERDAYAGVPFTRRATDSDLLDRLESLFQWRRSGSAKEKAWGAVERASRFWRQRLGVDKALEYVTSEEISPLLAAAFPDRIARVRSGQKERYLLANGQGGRLGPHASVRDVDWLVAVQVSGSATETRIDWAHAVTPGLIEGLFSRQVEWKRQVFWDDKLGRVVAREVRALGAIVLSERAACASEEEISSALLDGVRKSGLKCLNWSAEAGQWLSRARFVARICSEEGWPQLDDEHLEATLDSWLGPFLSGCRRMEELKRLDILPALRSLLSWEHVQRLDMFAPERLEVPSGSRIRLEYGGEEGPLLAVKLQEMFGLADTPRVADGRVPVVLHLLSPARRPLAVTTDLRSFWNDVYPDVKKEMKGRYPKHPWPDDPWQAEPTRFTKQRGGKSKA